LVGHRHDPQPSRARIGERPLDGVPHRETEQGAPDRREDGDPILLDVCVLRLDDLGSIDLLAQRIEIRPRSHLLGSSTLP
jgi:hypothetical protein